MGMLHVTDPIFISPWTVNALTHMSVITHFLTSDNYIIIKETCHIIAFTSRPLELYTDGVAS